MAEEEDRARERSRRGLSHLRLVRDEPPKPRERRPHVNHVLTPAEQTRARAALTGLRNAFGSWACVAAAMDVGITTLMAASRSAHNVATAILVRTSWSLHSRAQTLPRWPGRSACAATPSLRSSRNGYSSSARSQSERSAPPPRSRPSNACGRRSGRDTSLIGSERTRARERSGATTALMMHAQRWEPSHGAELSCYTKKLEGTEPQYSHRCGTGRSR